MELSYPPMTFPTENNERLFEAYNQLTRLAYGDYTARLPVSEEHEDPVEGFVSGLNMLADELEELCHQVKIRACAIRETIHSLGSNPSGPTAQQKLAAIQELSDQIEKLLTPKSVKPTA